MRPFESWPRWALEAVRAVLTRVPIMSDTLMLVLLEIWSRDTFTLSRDNSVPAHPVAPIQGVQ